MGLFDFFKRRQKAIYKKPEASANEKERIEFPKETEKQICYSNDLYIFKNANRHHLTENQYDRIIDNIIKLYIENCNIKKTDPVWKETETSLEISNSWSLSSPHDQLFEYIHISFHKCEHKQTKNDVETSITKMPWNRNKEKIVIQWTPLKEWECEAVYRLVDYESGKNEIINSQINYSHHIESYLIEPFNLPGIWYLYLDINKARPNIDI